MNKHIIFCLNEACVEKEKEICEAPFKSLSDNILEIFVGLNPRAKCPKNGNLVEYKIRRNTEK